MPNQSDQSVSLFAGVTLTTAYQDSASQEIKEIGKVTLLGTMTLNSATFVTLRVEVSADGSAWRPLVDVGSATAAAGISTREILDQEVKRTISGAMPALTFEPDAAFFRVRAKCDVDGAVLTLDGYLAEKEIGK